MRCRLFCCFEFIVFVCLICGCFFFCPVRGTVQWSHSALFFVSGVHFVWHVLGSKDKAFWCLTPHWAQKCPRPYPRNPRPTPPFCTLQLSPINLFGFFIYLCIATGSFFALNCRIATGFGLQSFSLCWNISNLVTDQAFTLCRDHVVSSHLTLPRSQWSQSWDCNLFPGQS